MHFRFLHFLPLFCLSLLIFLSGNIKAQAQQNSLQLIKNRLTTEKASLKISEQDINTIVVNKDYTDATSGIRHIYAEQKLNGLTVTQSNYSLHISGAKQVDAANLISTTEYSVKPVISSITSSDAIGRLMNDINYSGEKNFQIKEPSKGTDQVTIYKRAASPIWDIPTRLVYYTNVRLKVLQPAWEIQMMDIQKKHYWLAYVDAASGKVIEKLDLILHCEFGGPETDANVMDHSEHKYFFTENTDKKKLDKIYSVNVVPSNKYRVYDMPLESPGDTVQQPALHAISTRSGDTLGSPDGWHKVDGAAAYPYTRGNNVWAFQDPSPGPLGGVPSTDPTRTAYNNGGPSGTPSPVEPFTFDYPINLANQPETYQNGAIVNLFYWNNLMHDVYYYFGFTEAGGNFEASHLFSTGLKSGGVAGDDVLAQAQDGGGTNNANFLTAPDGTNGQMQMYLWTAAFADSLVQITSSLPGNFPPPGTKYIALQGSFGTAPTANTNLFTNPVINKQFVIVKKNALSTVGSDTEGCSTGNNSIALPPSNDVTNKIVLIDRGSCAFVEKVYGAQLGGAVGVIVINNVDGPPISMGGTDAPGNLITIPAVMISKADGALLKSRLIAGVTIIGSLKRNAPPAPKRDGDLDNGVIAHEYGHGISTRSTAPNTLGPLSGQEQGGEGWSDYIAMYMTLRTNDLTAATPVHPNGVLPTRSIGNYVTYQPADGRGIRPTPYSIDKNINPSTFKDIGKGGEISIPHGVGYIWATMMYEMQQLLIDKYGMSDNVYNGANPTPQKNPPATAGGNNIAMRLIIEGIRLQGTAPTFQRQRDAILKADTLLYNAQNACLIWQAFATRGLGFSSRSNTNAVGDEIEAFNVPLTCDPTQKRIRIEKTGNPKVTNGGFVDYTIKVTNIFPTSITAMTVKDTLASSLTIVSASDAPVVSGNIITWTFDLAPSQIKTLTLRARVSSTVGSTVIFFDDQESGPGKWDSTSTYPGASWKFKNDATQAYSGSKYWFVEDYDIPGSNVSLTTKNAINISTSSELVFFHKFATEARYDGGVVEVSTDNLTWTYLPPTKFVKGNYNTIIPTTNNPLIGPANLAAFGGSSPGYIVSIASLSDYAGKNVFIRFRFTSDPTGGSVTGGGWWIDDVYVLNNRTEVVNSATGRTDFVSPIFPVEGPNAFTSTSAFLINSVVLPIGLGNLSGFANNTAVTLKWNAQNEQNIAKYEIERKGPGENDFRSIGTLNGRNIASTQNYQFADINVSSGKDYLYRVKQITFDGTAYYTNIVYMKIAGKNLQIVVYPNPAKDLANLSITNPKGNAINIIIYDVSGSKLAELKGGNGNSVNISLPVQALAAGTYWLEVRTGDESITTRFIKN